MSQQMFITVAPVGAVPKRVAAREPKFVPAALVGSLLGGPDGECVVERLRKAGWEKAGAGGLGLSEGVRLRADDLSCVAGQARRDVVRQLREDGWVDGIDGCFQLDPAHARAARTVVPGALLRSIPSAKLARELVLLLTGQGWLSDSNGSLIWPHERIEAYLPPAIVAEIREHIPAFVDDLLGRGWNHRGPGYWNPMRGASPFMPVTPEDIVLESLEAIQEGAAIVHLHTRDCTDAEEIRLAGLRTPLWISGQSNFIDVDQYDTIVPRLHGLAPHAILNLSTSVRGGASDFESPIRRAHIKAFGRLKRAPEMCSFSPGEVIFQAGGGYDNPPEFLNTQLAHCIDRNVRPEIEVFNWEILHQALGAYREALVGAGTPVMFMLVVGVDQFQGDLHDDSLIPVAERQEMLRHIMEGTADSLRRAADSCIERLRPIVDRIRERCPASKVSILLPGPMLQIMAPVAAALRLDGVRVGLEDALTVPDASVAGGVRKCTSADQVRYIRRQLEALGVSILGVGEVRRLLGMAVPGLEPRRVAPLELRPSAVPESADA